MYDIMGYMTKESCMFFYVSAILSFALFVITISIGIFISKNKWIIILLSSIGPLIAYYFYRILYTMCEQTL